MAEFATICKLLDQARQFHLDAHETTEGTRAALHPLAEAYIAAHLDTE